MRVRIRDAAVFAAGGVAGGFGAVVFGSETIGVLDHVSTMDPTSTTTTIATIPAPPEVVLLATMLGGLMALLARFLVPRLTFGPSRRKRGD
jgi:hypothetical protein